MIINGLAVRKSFRLAVYINLIVIAESNIPTIITRTFLYIGIFFHSFAPFVFPTLLGGMGCNPKGWRINLRKQTCYSLLIVLSLSLLGQTSQIQLTFLQHVKLLQELNLQKSSPY
jgi:hypothetical protein